uniref:Uncharacterized protein n=2 Tax=Mesocestoides corti TaxID=53468 RepID=A0A5K3FKU3_MESCO
MRSSLVQKIRPLADFFHCLSGVNDSVRVCPSVNNSSGLLSLRFLLCRLLLLHLSFFQLVQNIRLIPIVLHLNLIEQ